MHVLTIVFENYPNAVQIRFNGALLVSGASLGLDIIICVCMCIWM